MREKRKDMHTSCGKILLLLLLFYLTKNSALDN